MGSASSLDICLGITRYWLAPVTAVKPESVEVVTSGISIAPPEQSWMISRHPNPSTAGCQRRSDIKNTKDEDDKDDDKDNDDDKV